MLEALKLLQTEDILVVFGQNKNNQLFKLQKELSNLWMIDIDLFIVHYKQ